MSKDNFLELYDYMSKVSLVIVIDHSRAGNGFFKRIFDQHDQVLSITAIGYLYGAILDLFGDRNRITGKEAYEWATGSSNVSFISQPPTLLRKSSIVRIGNDVTSYLNYEEVNLSLLKLLKDKPFITRKDTITSIHLAYAIATGRDVKKIKYILLDDGTSSRDDRKERSEKIFQALRSDYEVFKVIHLVRDPRACFSSLKHQYINRFTMYPAKIPKYIWKATCCNSVLIWILRYTIDGLNIMLDWQERLDENLFYRVRNEDLNLNFIKTIGSLCKWLDINFDDRWMSEDYTPTAEGVPWKGISAYSSRFTGGEDCGPIENEVGEGCFPGPNKYVTERWREKLLTREVKFVESVYYQEMQMFDYKCDFVSNNWDICGNFFYGLLPFRGEFPRLKWWLCGRKSVKEFLKRLNFILAFVPSYLISRGMLVYFKYSGKLQAIENGPSLVE